MQLLLDLTVKVRNTLEVKDRRPLAYCALRLSVYPACKRKKNVTITFTCLGFLMESTLS